jgi:hypothetical protein
MAGGVKGRAVAFAVKGAVGFGFKFAFAVGADGGKGKQLSAPADNEKSLVAKITVNAVGGKTARRPDVDRASSTSGGDAATFRRLVTGSQPGGQQQKLAAVHFHAPLILKYQAGENARMHIRSGVIIHRENKADSQAWLNAPDSFEIHAKGGIAKQAGIAGISMVRGSFTF